MSVLGMCPGDKIVAVRPQTCSGAGWNNRVMWVYIRGEDGMVREACLQPEEQPLDATLLFVTGEAAQDELIKILGRMK